MKKLIPLFAFIALVLVGLSFIYLSEDSEECKDCNVILISIDTLRPDHLGMYGYEKPTSPNLDKFASKGQVYENFYSTSAWTLPAHASMFTSLSPKEARMQTIVDKLPESAVTITDVLKDNGYYTIGWDGNTFVSPRWGFDQGFDEYKVVSSIREGHHDADKIFPQAIDWMKNNKRKKFFMFLHTFQVHDPYCPPKEFDKFKGDYKGEETCIDISKISEENRGERESSREELERYKSLYDGEILYTDKYLGDLFKLLEQPERKNTIVLITSDHGEEFGERMFWGVHTYSLYNELVRVPMIIKGPNVSSGVEDKIASMIDIPPTILDLLGLPIDAAFKGRSLFDEEREGVAIFESSNTKIDVIVNLDKGYASFSDLKPQERGDNSVPIEKEGIAFENWKLIRDYLNKEDLLFDLGNDPDEKNAVKNDNMLEQLKGLIK